MSDIDGLGLFCVTHINKGYSLGISHVEDSRFPNRFIRTPLGGFINHSAEPNIKKIKDRNTFLLYTIQKVPMGSELTLQYEWYEVGGDNNDNER